MATSGVLISKAAAALGMEEGVVSTVIKSLRAHRMISMRGRGVNAAAMTPEDVAALLAGIATGAGTADIPLIAKILLNMPARHEVRHEKPLDSLARNPLNTLPPEHTFSEGLAALLREEIDPARDEYGEVTGSNPLAAGARVVIGLDGKKKRGFASLRGFVRRSPVSLYYSDLAKRNDVLPNAEPSGLGLELYENPPPFVLAVILEAAPLLALARAVAPHPEH